MQPYLFIGIGGTGGKTLRYIWREMGRRLRTVGWSEPYLPRCFGFLNIDLPARYDGDTEPEVPVVRDLATTHYVGLGAPDTTYATYDGQAAAGDRGAGLHRWRPWPTHLIVPPAQGAGQRRAVGRVVTALQLPLLTRHVTAELNNLTSQSAHRDLVTLRTLLPDGQLFEGEGKVVIISSIAGGAGAGMLLDVIEAVRFANTSFPGHENPTSILVTPDVFETGATGPRHGLHGNALSTLAELVNAAEHTGPLPPQELKLRGGVQPSAGARVGRNNFLVGRSNGEVSFKRPAEVYEAVGRTLTALALSPTHQQPFDQYIDVNSVPTPLTRSLGTQGTVSSLGYAVVGLGRHIFRDYAAERLAREILERLLRGHEQQDTDLPSDVRLQRAIEIRWPGFAAETGLLSSDDSTGIMTVLRDEVGLKERLTAAKDAFLSKLASRNNEFDGEQWIVAHEGEYRAHATQLEDQERATRNERARDWSNRVQTELLSLVVDEVATQGLPVALGLLRRLEEAVRTESADLRRKADESSEKEGNFLRQAGTVLRKITSRVGTSAPEHEESARRRLSGLLMRFESEAADLGAILLDDVASNLIPPLRRALEGALNDLAVAEEDEATRLTVQRWTRGPVPPHLLPAANEELIEPANGFPDVLTRLLTQLFPGTAPIDAVRAATTEIVTGRWPSHGGETLRQTFVSSDATWEPREGQARWGDLAASAAAFQVSVRTMGLPQRAADWLTRRQGPVREYIDQSLAEYLADQAAGARHKANFLRSLELALARSRPFVGVDMNVAARLHGTGDYTETRASVSTIPVAQQPGQEPYDSIVQALEAAKVPSDAVRFDPASTTAEIDIIRYPTRKFHPAAIESLTGSIRTAWQEDAADEAGRARFWSSRRTRALEAFVPLPGDRIDDLIRGFFVATTFGHFPLPDGEPWGGTPRRLWSPAGWLELPTHLLDPAGVTVRHNSHVLPGLLETFPMCWLDVGQPSSPLPAYERLMELGAITDGGCHPEILEWMRSGPVPAADLPGRPALDGDLGDPEDRRRRLVDRLEDLATRWDALDTEGIAPSTPPRDVRAANEVGPRVAEALRTLTTAVRSARIDGAPDPDDPLV